MRGSRIPHGLLFLAILAMPAGPAWAAAPAPSASAARPIARAEAVSLALKERARGALKRFYAERDFRPLWAAGGRIGPAAGRLLSYLETAHLDGLKPSRYDVGDVRAAMVAARSGDPEAVAEAEIALSEAFARYARDQRRPGEARMNWADRSLKPRRLRPEQVLRAAAFPKSFDDYLADMAWMSPHYVRMRQLVARAEKDGLPEDAIRRLRLNLDRARLLPGPWTHHVVVDASSARLWYYGQGKQQGTMRVVVGTRETQTPMLAGMLQWAIVNPYWNVPDYLVRNTVAPKVLAGRSLASMHMEALSDWSANPRRLDPAAIDWAAVAAGERDLRVRELPGAHNSMGRVKFIFPNDEGIYLHDTPNRDLLRKADRHFSNGCIRLEKAEELGRWLLQKPARIKSSEPEQPVPLPVAVPVYITYLTADAGKAGIVFREDVYGRDR